MIDQELELLEEDANVFKLIGPVLVKQDLAEAKANVNKRIEYILAELWALCPPLLPNSIVPVVISWSGVQWDGPMGIGKEKENE